MKSIIALASLLFFASTAFGNIDAICNIKGGYSIQQKTQGLPSTIVAKLTTSGDLAKSTTSFEIDGLSPLQDVEYNTPDENMISADYKITGSGKSVRYQVIFYVGGTDRFPEF